MPECPESFPFTIPIIRFTMEDDRPASSERQQTKKMSLLTPVKIEVPDPGRRSSEPTRYYIPPQCNNKLSPRAARKHDSKRKSKLSVGGDNPCKETFGPKPCNCEDCRASSPLPPGYGPPTMSPGYDQMKSSLLEVPWSEDYTEASSDDLSSEWDSDAPEPAPTPRPTQKLGEPMDIGYWNGPQRGGQTTSGESLGAAGGKRPRAVDCGTPYKRPMCKLLKDQQWVSIG
ncbi:jg19813 [Pararge aegeria aegeria]|uniref:Jg19813 protein n=1 Tax=Pararge aegeria aegeria TaxID=348720 RepID=A0A8S4SKT9_9NEOP|nr:jg19813 [Pararge aegeria aegeria]